MCFLSGSSTRITFSPFFKSIRAGLPFWRHPRRCCCCTDLLQGQKAFLLVACRYADSQPCSWTSHRALGEFCESGGLRKSDHKSRSPILSVWCLHRGTRAVASGDVLLRIYTEYTAADCHADFLSAFQKKGYLLPFYMIGYGVIRCFVEGLRTDSLYLMPGVRVSQVLSGCLILLGVLLIGIIRRRKDIQV